MMQNRFYSNDSTFEYPSRSLKCRSRILRLSVSLNGLTDLRLERLTLEKNVLESYVANNGRIRALKRSSNRLATYDLNELPCVERVERIIRLGSSYHKNAQPSRTCTYRSQIFHSMCTQPNEAAVASCLQRVATAYIFEEYSTCHSL